LDVITILKKHILLALFYFFLTALLGVILRFFPITNLDVTYKFIVHTHSHIALLGWVYTALTTLIYTLFLNKNKKHYLRIFWLTQFSIIGMLCSFPFQGYALFSIFFSTLFLFASYLFLNFFLKNTSPIIKQRYSYKLIKVSLWFMVLSSIGPWVLGGIMSTLGNTSIWYKIAIYFYLHFQYNGWFILALFGIFFYILEEKKILPKKQDTTAFYWLMIPSILLTFFLSVLWTKPHAIFYILAGIGSVLQILAIGKFIQILQKNNLAKITDSKTKFLLKTAFAFLLIKIILQTSTLLPYFANLPSQILHFVIGYIHLIFLGIISISLFALLHHFKLIKLSKGGYTLFLIGFLITEVLIFYKGFSIWLLLYIPENYLLLLAIFSIFMGIGILWIFLKNVQSFLNTKQ